MQICDIFMRLTHGSHAGLSVPEDRMVWDSYVGCGSDYTSPLVILPSSATDPSENPALTEMAGQQCPAFFV